MITSGVTYLFLATATLSLLLFLAAELVPTQRQLLAGLAAVFEGFVFFELSYIFSQIEWGIHFDQAMAIIPAVAALFCFRLAYRRYTGDNP